MTENAYSTPDELAEHATWAVNSLIESGDDDLAADVAADYGRELEDARVA